MILPWRCDIALSLRDESPAGFVYTRGVIQRRGEKRTLSMLLLIAAGVFGACINWGLPGRDVDRFLFGNRTPWTGQEILQLLPKEDEQHARGSDVDANPVTVTDGALVLNETDAQRAEIVRRYRLFSYQPDEMITLMSLSRMKPGQGKLDPGLYQYGGLWIYPVGAMLKVAAITHLVRLESNQAFYLDHPAEFGKFYIVMRAYVVMWALIGVWAIFWIARRLTSDLLIAFASTLCCIFMPVVLNLAHEAKPHLPGAVLTLLAVICATRFVETGKTRHAVFAGLMCGGAFGMVISAALSFIVLPAMVFLRDATFKRRMLLLTTSTAAGLVVYAATNPYVLVHLIGDRSVLMSNLGNSKAMYDAAASGSAVLDGLWRLCEGTSFPLLIIGVVGAVWWCRAKLNVVVILLAFVCLPILIQFFLLASGKPSEYARFAVLPSICLGLVGVSALPLGFTRFPRTAAMLLCCITGVYAASYLWHLGRDCVGRSPRIIAAERLQKHLGQGFTSVTVRSEPAPYCLPPVDLFETKIVLLRGSAGPQAPTIEVTPIDLGWDDRIARDVEIWPRSRLFPTPLSWASKSMRVKFWPDSTNQSSTTKSVD